MSSTNQIEGTWKLHSFEIEPNDGPRFEWGEHTHGLLFYSATGYMSVAINRDIVNKSENEFQNLFDSILFYAGTYRIEGNLIQHQVTEASNPTRIGREMLRYTEFEGEQITLTTPYESFGRAILIWRRI